MVDFEDHEQENYFFSNSNGGAIYSISNVFLSLNYLIKMKMIFTNMR